MYLLRPSRRLAVVAAVLGSGMVVFGQLNPEALLAKQKTVLPAAATFSAKEGQPPHFKAYAADKTLVGYVFWSTELQPLERGYDGPIKMLIGMDTHGVLTGVIVVDHHEPFGSFSVVPPRFAAQFRGKSIKDPFKLGQDVDAVATATITMSSAYRSVKNSARLMARQYLTPEALKSP